MNELKKQIKAEANRLGFSLFGVAEPKQTPHFNNYLDWINSNQNAGMDYLIKDYVIKGRRNPEILLDGTRSVIVVGIHYFPELSYAEVIRKDNDQYGLIAAYSVLTDYHQKILDLLIELTSTMDELEQRKTPTKIFIDSGPVMEKDFAFQAGLGWIGKNSLLISPEYGSYCLIGCLFTDLELNPDSPIKGDICVDCQICINSCPTGCINNNRTINAESCISYLTIEYSSEFQMGMGDSVNSWVFGCDICQLVCPANIQITRNNHKNTLQPCNRTLHQRLDLKMFQSINEKEFSKFFFGTPVSRIGYRTFMRNINNALQNKAENTT